MIRLSYYLGWTTAQIAAELETTESIVRSRLHYALRMLQLTLDELETSQRRALPPLTGSAVKPTELQSLVNKVYRGGDAGDETTQSAMASTGWAAGRAKVGDSVD